MGFVLDDEHNPISNATVVLSAFHVEILTNSDGSFEFRSVPVGKQVVEAHASGHKSASRAAQVTATEPVKLDFVLPVLPVQIPHYLPFEKKAVIGQGGASAVNQCQGCAMFFEFPVDPDYLLVEVQGKHQLSNPADKDGISIQIHKVTGTGLNQQNGAALHHCGLFEGKPYTLVNQPNTAYDKCSQLPQRILFDAQKLNETAPGGPNTRGIAVSLKCDETWYCLDETYRVYVTAFYYWAPEDVPAEYSGSDPGNADCFGTVCYKAQQPSSSRLDLPENSELPARGKAHVIHLVHVPVISEPGTPWFLWSLVGAALAASAGIVFVMRRRMRHSPADLLDRARQCFQSGDDVETKRLASRVLRASPQNADAWFLYGAALLAKGQNERAIEELEAAMKEFGPQLSGLAYVLSLAHQRAGSSEAARRWLPLVAKESELWASLGQNTDFKLIRDQASRLGRKKPAPVDPSYV